MSQIRAQDVNDALSSFLAVVTVFLVATLPLALAYAVWISRGTR